MCIWHQADRSKGEVGWNSLPFSFKCFVDMALGLMIEYEPVMIKR
jgi:hypothetical protein